MKFFLILNLVCLITRFAGAQTTYIEYLNEKDKQQYSLNCKKKNLDGFEPKCLNFLGIKIFYASIQEVLDDEKKRIELQKISTSLIKRSADMGFRKAFFNLGWIYSNDKFFNQDLEKASFYFKQAKKRTVSEKKIDSVSQSELKKIQKSNFFYLQLAIGLFENIKLYHISKVKGHEQYITKQQFDIAKSLYVKILDNSYFSGMDIGAIKKNVISERSALISFLAEDLKIFKDEYRKNAIKDLNKLYNIRNKLDKLEAR